MRLRVLPVSDPGIPDRRSPLRYLCWLARTEARSLTAGALLGVLWMLSMALMPAAIGRAIDDGLAARDTAGLLIWCGALLALGATQAVTGVLRHRVAVYNWLSAAYRTVQVVTRQATRLGATLPKRISTGEVVSVGITDISHIGDALDIVSRGSGAVISIAVVAVLLLAASAPLGLIVVLGVPVILVLCAPLLRPLHHRQTEQRELVGELTGRATDIVAGLRVLRGIGGERVFAGRYRDQSQRVRSAGVRIAKAESRLSGAEVLLPGLLIALVTWVGARYAMAGRISVGHLVSCYGYAVFLIHPMRTLGEAADKITKGLVAARRVVRVLDIAPELPDTGTAVPAPGTELIDLESGLVVRPGLVTAIAAADPADARAIADRLGRYTEGAVDWGGVPMRDVADVRDRVLVAVNEDMLFSGPLSETIGNEETVYAANAEDIVAAAGADAYVAESGREFSGGQQQRLRLARALAADPEVLVLVEPTSAVDAHTEARVADRLGAARAGRTTVVCTTSPLVLDRADHVAYVEDGMVVAEGTHRDLLGTEPRYSTTVTREEATASP